MIATSCVHCDKPLNSPLIRKWKYAERFVDL